MGWFSKKEDKALLPDLPEDMELPKLPESPSDSWRDVTVTSSVPNVINLKQKRPSWLPPPPSIKAESNKIIAEPMTESVAEPMTKTGFVREPLVREPMVIELAESFSRKPSKIKKIEPIYIRLDKFKQVIESFEEIKNKVQEIEDLLKEVKELREKEEKELEEWEKEIQIIKSRIEAIDKNVFSELD